MRKNEWFIWIGVIIVLIAGWYSTEFVPILIGTLIWLYGDYKSKAIL